MICLQQTGSKLTVKDIINKYRMFLKTLLTFHPIHFQLDLYNHNYDLDRFRFRNLSTVFL